MIRSLVRRSGFRGAAFSGDRFATVCIRGLPLLKLGYVRISHRVHTSAPLPDVWAVLSEPQRWPEFELSLARVEGVAGSAAQGQRLVAISRGFGLRLPVDIGHVVPRKALLARVRLLPGYTEDVEYVLVPAARGGTDITVIVSAAGPLARIALLPVWGNAALGVRLLARRAVDERRHRLRSTGGAA
jgi:hypothetical protein